MVKLGTVQITHNVPFQMYLLSNVRLKRMLLEYQFHSVRFYREERAKEFTVCLDYPYGNLYWFVDFKKSVEELLEKDSQYAEDWELFLTRLKHTIKEEFEGLSGKLEAITPRDVVRCMHTYNLRDYQAFDLIQLCIKMRQFETPAGLILSEQRTGKTRVAVAAVREFLPESGAVAIICPKSAIQGWVDEFKTMNEHFGSDVFDVMVLKHTRDLKKTDDAGYHSVKIISYELFKRFTYAQLRKAICTGYENVMLVVDEAHRLRNFKTLQSEVLFRFKEGCLKDGLHLSIIGITGTPAIKSSSDVFGVLSLINTSRMGFQPYFKDFNQFKEYFYNCEDTSYGKVCKTLKRTHELNFLIQNTSVQTKQRDLEMFSGYTKKHLTVHLDMDEHQREIYDSVFNTMEYGEDIDCVNGLVQLTRLQQICIDPSSLVPSYDRLAPKLEWILEYTRRKRVKTIFMAKKVKALDAVHEMFLKNGISHCYIKGSTPLKARADAVDNFRKHPELKYMLIQLDVGKEALTLPEAVCTVFLDRDFAQGFNEQAEARMTPIDGGECTKYVIDLIMRDTVEEGIYNVLVIRKGSIEDVNTISKICTKGGS